jgi:hypothetical protein
MSDYRDLGPVMIGVNSMLIALSLAAIGCRIERTRALRRSYGWHDGELSSYLEASYWNT